MLCTTLFEAAEDDLRYQRLANKWMLAFTGWMDKHNSDTPLGEIAEFHYWPATMRDGKSIDILYLPAWRVGIDVNDLSFGIGWVPDGSTDNRRAFILAGIQENRRHYYVVMMAKRDPRQETDVLWGLPMDSFVHEVMHYFDYKRGYDRALYLQRLRNAGKSDQKRLADRGPAAYYNDPLELNAHFQQGLGSLFVSLASKLAQKAHFGEADPADWLDSFDAFLKRYIKTADQQKDQYLQYISEPNKRKMIRRLYKVYTLIRQQWPDLPEIQEQARDYVAKWQAEDAQREMA